MAEQLPCVGIPPLPEAVHGLMDLVHLLSLDGFDASLWSQLDREARGRFKLACRDSRQTADLLTTSAHMPVSEPSIKILPVASHSQVCQDAFAQHLAFLLRLPRLSSLTLLQFWETEVSLVEILGQYVDATGGRITRLVFHAEHLSHAGVAALCHACPRLAELELHGASAREQIQLHGALFLPFRGGQLRKLTAALCTISRDALASLAGLASLQHLTLDAVEGGGTGFQQVRCLTGLTALRHCDLHLRGQASLADVAFLFQATQLTWLRIDGVGNARPTAEPAAAAADAASAALLGGLSHLRSLDLGPDFRVGPFALAALGEMPHLTRLRVCCITPAPAGPQLCQLPQLEALRLGYEGESQALSDVLDTLLWLLPLPSLRTVEGTLALSISYGGDPDDPHGLVAGDPALDDAQAAATAVAAALTLRSIASRLAAAPCLCLPAIAVSGVRSMRHFLSLGQVLDGLQPLGGRLRSLSLLGVGLDDADWGAVHRCLPGLTHLTLDDQHSCRINLAALVRGLAALQHLDLMMEHTVMVDGWHPVPVGWPSIWLQLAAAVDRPLRMRVSPRVHPTVVAQCREEQERVYGVQNMEWLT